MNYSKPKEGCHAEILLLAPSHHRQGEGGRAQGREAQPRGRQLSEGRDGGTEIFVDSTFDKLTTNSNCIGVIE